MENNALSVGLMKGKSVMVCSEWQIEFHKLREFAGIE
jgi:hypothetical protein